MCIEDKMIAYFKCSGAAIILFSAKLFIGVLQTA